MTSACIFKDTLRNHTQVFSNLETPFLRFVYISSTWTALLTSYIQWCWAAAREHQTKSRLRKVDSHYPQYWSLYQSSSIEISCFDKKYSIYSSSFDISSNISLDSTDSDVFYVEQISNEPSPQRNNSPDILNSTERSEHHATRMPSISTIASPQPYIFTINDDSNEPTIPYGFGRQLPIVPPRLIDLSQSANPFNILATMAIATNTGDASNDNYSPQSPEPSDPSPISTPPMNVSPFNSWETSYTTTDIDAFCSSDEPRRINFFPPSPASLPSPPRKLKRRLSLGKSFPKKGERRSTSAKPAVRRSPQ